MGYGKAFKSHVYRNTNEMEGGFSNLYANYIISPEALKGKGNSGVLVFTNTSDQL